MKNILLTTAECEDIADLVGEALKSNITWSKKYSKVGTDGEEMKIKIARKKAILKKMRG